MDTKPNIPYTKTTAPLRRCRCFFFIHFSCFIQNIFVLYSKWQPIILQSPLTRAFPLWTPSFRSISVIPNEVRNPVKVIISSFWAQRRTQLNLVLQTRYNWILHAPRSGWRCFTVIPNEVRTTQKASVAKMSWLIFITEPKSWGL